MYATYWNAKEIGIVS